MVSDFGRLKKEPAVNRLFTLEYFKKALHVNSPNNYLPGK
jgi:hypothetical protein